MNRLLLAAIVVSWAVETQAMTIYEQPANPAGGLYQSSWWDPDGSDYDQYVWDAFVLPSSMPISTIEWRGGFDPTHFGMGGPVVDFDVAICASIPAGTQPDVISPPLVLYQTGGNAGQILAGTFGGTTLYDYSFVLPVPFQATGGTKYWLQIEAYQHGIPDWGLTVGTGGDGHYFRRIANVGDIFYQLVPGDAAFRLVTPTSATEHEPLAFALAGVWPNPASRGRFNVSFALAANAPAWLDLIDVRGRRVATCEVGGLGRGAHTLAPFAGVPIAPGVYFLRLQQGSNVRTSRVTFLR